MVVTDNFSKKQKSYRETVKILLNRLKRRSQRQRVEKILSSPAFDEAMEAAQNKLRSGTTEWHSYDEVFGDE